MTTNENILVSFRSTAFYSNLVHILKRHFGRCHFLIWFLNSANVIEFFILFGRSFHIYVHMPFINKAKYKPTFTCILIESETFAEFNSASEEV